MGRKAVGPVCCVMHVKEPRTLIVKEKGACPGVSYQSQCMHFIQGLAGNILQTCNFSRFFLISGFYFTNLPLPQHVLERRERATKKLVLMWRGCKSSKTKHPRGSGGFYLDQRETPDCLLLSNHTPVLNLLWNRFCLAPVVL